MKTKAFPLFAIPMLLAPLAATPREAQAQSINRCEAADGTTIFTDKSCAAFGARPAGEIAFDTGAGGSGELRDPPGTLGRNGATGGFAIKGCARTQGELIAGVRGAIESGDVNRLTNYYHWTGVSSSGSVGLLDRLDKIVRNTMSGVQFDYEPTFQYSTASIQSVPEPEYRPMPVAEVVYAAGPSYMDRYRPENDDAPILSSGVVDASTPLAEVLPEIRAREAAANSPDTGLPVSGAIVDASTPLDEARAMTLGGGGGGSWGYPETDANPKPVALRVNHGGGGGTRFSLRQNAGCWFIQF